MPLAQATYAALFGYCGHAVIDRLTGVRPDGDIIYPALIMVTSLILLVLSERK